MLWYSWEQASVLPLDPNGSSFSDRAPFWDNPTHSPQRFGYWPSLHSNLSFKYVFDHKGLKAIQNFSGIEVFFLFFSSEPVRHLRLVQAENIQNIFFE